MRQLWKIFTFGAAFWSLSAFMCRGATVLPQTLAPSSSMTPLPSSMPVSTTTSAFESRPTHTLSPSSNNLIQPEDLIYLGAFRLPDGEERPKTFAYGGSAMTVNPLGNSSAVGDGLPGSLFITGHDRLPYGELSNGGQVAEISVPLPLKTRDVSGLNQAVYIQDFQDVAQGFFQGMDEIPRMGLLYLDAPATGPKLHLAWGQHLQPADPSASHAWFDLTLDTPNLQGPWFLSGVSPYSGNGYLLEIPANWSQSHLDGLFIGAGRFRDGGWGGMGPSLIAYQPWVDESGTPAQPGDYLSTTPLILYQSSEEAIDFSRALAGYQHPDEWEGSAWITTPDGRSALLFAGTKGTGSKYWYGYPNPSDPLRPCVEVEMVGEATICLLANGSPCPSEDLTGCADHSDYRGWWSSRFEAQFILYNPDDLVRVTTGELLPWQPQPYAVINLDAHLYHNPSGVELEMLGSGEQRRFRIGEVAYDRQNGLLYVLERYADDAKPVVHVWKVQ